ncbi:RecF/RecN/SMC protein (fragment) [Candidatus Sulfopaludibacter sp. SbA3]
MVTNPIKNVDLRHVISIRQSASRFEVADERIEDETADPDKPDSFYYRYRRGNPVLRDLEETRDLKREQFAPGASILSQLKDPERYPMLTRLQDAYSNIRLFRNWSFGPGAALRREQAVYGRSDVIEDGGGNLALVLSNLSLSKKLNKELIPSLKKLYGGIEDITFRMERGTMQLFVEEAFGRRVPATRLSDGTLRYLYMLVILLDPDPPPLIAIEEPELGLHPDVISQIAELLIDAAERTQLVVTTHSRMLVDALAEQPEAVIVCEKGEDESCFERLDGEHLKDWLERYSLGELWSMGELGGNRW